MSGPITKDPCQGLVPTTLADWQMYRNDSLISQFRAVALIADEATKLSIEQHCVEHGYSAGIDYVPAPGVECYVWHTLIEHATNCHWDFSLQRRIEGRHPRLLTTEQKLVSKILKILEAHNITAETEVECAAGKADIVTKQRDIIYEVKGRLSRPVLFQAVGQVLLYRASINSAARVAIIGYPTAETAALQPVIEALGIRVILWKD